MPHTKRKADMAQNLTPNQTEADEKLIKMEQKAAELEDKLKRSLADYSNLEKRIESQRQLFVTLATTAIISRMVEVLDDLYLAQNHLKDMGLKMGIDKLLQVLKSEGLEEIKAEGEDFDPELMECIEVRQGDENKVLEVKKNGYKLNGHVIRPAQVVVGKN